MSPAPSATFHRATLTERILMRDEMYSNFLRVKIWPVEEDLWACDVAGVITEHAGVGELFRFLADVAEES